MEICIGNIVINVTKKNIKHLHIYVDPPYGTVSISAPQNMTDKAIESFARVNFDWIIKQKKQMLDQPRQTKRNYVSGETYYIFGIQYFMIFKESSHNYLSFEGNNIILGMRKNSSQTQRNTFFRETLRTLLNAKLEKLIPKWENITGLYCNNYKIRYMTSRWGSCNAENKTIILNLQLAEKPIECIEYVILHELVHLKVKNHGKDFIALMDSYMPNWCDIKHYLNSLLLNAS